MKKIIVDKEIVKELERLQYQVDCRKDIINHMLSSEINVNEDKFEKYQEKYKEYFIQYNKLKNQVTEKYVDFPYKSWNLNFDTCQLSVEQA